MTSSQLPSHDTPSPNEYNAITDFNKTFLDIFKLKPEDLRSKNFIKFLNDRGITKKAVEKIEKELQKAMIGIKNKYGKNAILKGMNLQEGATTIDRNKQIGGHKG